MPLDPQLQQRLSDLVASDRVVLFMKGTRHFPQCGFSATVAQILNGLVKEYTTVNVLAEPAIRDGIKLFSEWPTIPQLYIDGKFVGGCDIVRDMFQAGELQGLLGVAAPALGSERPKATKPPKLTVSDAAKRAVTEAQASEPGTLRLEISADFEHALSIDEARPDDFQIDLAGFTLLVDPGSAVRAEGVSIDYESKNGGGFSIENPNEPPKVRQISAEGLQKLKQAGEPFTLLDVRTAEERRIATISGDRVLDDAALRGLEKDAVIVVYCHHGGRSRAAAERLVADGWKQVYNLAGGIDGWSTLDPSVPRY